MSQNELEERLVTLERQMAELRAVVTKGQQEKNWQRTIGMFTGDEVMKRIDKAAKKYREADRAKARSRRPKK
jgi:hypothetical protein